jgi:hypothetical protein
VLTKDPQWHKSILESKIDLWIDRFMARTLGDGNYTAREKRLIAEKKALEADIKAMQAKLKAKDARIAELREKLGV